MELDDWILKKNVYIGGWELCENCFTMTILESPGSSGY